jgi:hypothetical protein
MRTLVASLVVFIAASASADTLSDLKNAVMRLQARQPVRATWRSEMTMKSAGRFSTANAARSVTAEVTHDGSGLAILIPQSLVDQASRTDGAQNEEAVNALGSINASQILNLLDHRNSLVTLLTHATVIAERREPYEGRSARVLDLRLNVPLLKSKSTIQIGSVKVTEDLLRVWVADNGLPLAAHRTRKTTAGFLMFHADAGQQTRLTFATAGDRLVITREEMNGSGSGLGQSVDGRSVETLTIH